MGFKLGQLLLCNVPLFVARNNLWLSREHCCHGKAFELLLGDAEDVADGLRWLDHERKRIVAIATADGEGDTSPFRLLDLLAFQSGSFSDAFQFDNHLCSLQ